MDIARMSMALSQGQVQQQASLSLLKKTMDMAEGNAAELINQVMNSTDVNALQHTAQPHLGSNIDIKG
ncbi:YjfB family protein [Robertmurraya massiliosenegalensis]|uniref:YjfB family protein n=1 Tax=Robertmurraya TaxID=2837507 RepID=UPI0039A4682F